MSTPRLHLKTVFVLSASGRIVSTREPNAEPGPLFSLVRNSDECVWAVRADVPDPIALEIDALAKTEPPVADLKAAPVHAQRYMHLLEPLTTSTSVSTLRQGGGPAFKFPETMSKPTGVEIVEDERLLNVHFQGWVP